MANERTFLAWIRTSIGIMAFGFVVEKFALFVNQITLLTGVNPEHTLNTAPTYSPVIGFILILLGAFASVMAYVKFRITTKQIDNENYRPFYLFDLILTIAVLVAGIILAFYLKPFKP